MKVKITKCQYEESWYRDKIGEIFEVHDNPEGLSGGFYAYDSSLHYMCIDGKHGIDVEDCEVVEKSGGLQ